MRQPSRAQTRTLRTVHRLLELSQVQVRQAGDYWCELPGMRDWRARREEEQTRRGIRPANTRCAISRSRNHVQSAALVTWSRRRGRMARASFSALLKAATTKKHCQIRPILNPKIPNG